MNVTDKDPIKKCDLCGTPVYVRGGQKEGNTNWYEPVNPKTDFRFCKTHGYIECKCPDSEGLSLEEFQKMRNPKTDGEIEDMAKEIAETIGATDSYNVIQIADLILEDLRSISRPASVMSCEDLKPILNYHLGVTSTLRNGIDGLCKAIHSAMLAKSTDKKEGMK